MNWYYFFGLFLFLITLTTIVLLDDSWFWLALSIEASIGLVLVWLTWRIEES